mgnify:FL=1
MNEYDRMCEDPEVDEEGHRVWPGFDWANPSADDNDEAMREALGGYQEEDGTWADVLIDDEAKVDALFEYLADPKHGFDIDEADYSAKAMAEMFEARCLVYDEGYLEIGRLYLDDHYGKVHEDPIVGMTDEDVKQGGVNLAGSEHEVERYLWVEADDGRVFCIVRPAYVKAEGNRT